MDHVRRATSSGSPAPGRTSVWWRAALQERSILIGAVLTCAGVAVLLLQTDRAQQSLIESAALEEAEQFAESVAGMRKLYTEEVVARLPEGIAVAHNYTELKNAVPLPATFTKMLGETTRDSGARVRLYSDYPFPLRKHDEPGDDFERTAMRALRANPDKPFYTIQGTVLRYATADIMVAACVDCHNTHKDSPKRDWKVGDVRGVLEVSVPLDHAMAEASASFRGTFITLFAFAIVGVGCLVLVVLKLRKQAARALKKAQQLGQYTLDEQIGEGTMGVVYRASHAMLRRPTALKLLRPEHETRERIERFEREVQHTSQLKHPNTIAIYDYGRGADGTFYYAMEFVDGISLGQLVDTEGPLPPARAVHILKQICGSLAEAHEAGIIHRDVKPANIMLCECGGIFDMVKVLDFGLVKRLSGKASELTLAGAVTGTPHYLSPEAIRTPDRVDARSDVYSVAAVGYFCLMGKPVFTADDSIGVLTQHLNESPPPLDAPAELEEVLRQCLEKDPDARPPSARAVLDLLEQLDLEWSNADARAWWEINHVARREGTPVHRALDVGSRGS